MPHELSRDPILRDVGEVEGYKVLGPCVLFSKIGQGGMGAVYRGQHANLEIEVAVKCLLPALMTMDGDLVTRFHREAQLAARVTHQNLVRVYDFGEQSGLHYLIMEYVTGESLRQRVERGGAASVAEAVTIVRQAAEGLAAAHAEEIVHRDIKPDNILISEKGVVKVADLGLGRIGHGRRDLTMSRVPMGTPTYMPPEQWTAIGSVGPEGDVWALGATLYFLLAGESAFKGAAMQEVQQQICGGPFPHDRLVDVPRDVLDVLCRCTQRKPEDRYASARGLADALGDVAARHRLHGDLRRFVRQTVFDRSTEGMGSVARPPRSVLDRVREEAMPSRMPTAPTVALAPGRGRWIAWAGGIAALVVLGFGSLVAFREWFASPRAEPQGSVVSEELPRFAGFTFVGTNAQTYHEYRHDPSGILMVLLPGGPFEMGSPGEDPDAVEDETPRHRVWLSPFLIAKYEVSQAEWERIMKGILKDHPVPTLDQDPGFPVVNVSWDECQVFCRETGLALPSEAQWEFACRAGTRTPFAFGSTVGPGQANFDNGEGGLVPVTALTPNRFGLFNLHGNVAEWCQDIYHQFCYEEAKEAGERVDPVCDEGEATFRVYRGGSFEAPMSECRSARRRSEEPGFGDPTIGFRPVFNVK